MFGRFASRPSSKALAAKAAILASAVAFSGGCAYNRVCVKGMDPGVSRPAGLSGPLFVTELTMDFELPTQYRDGPAIDFGLPGNVFSTNYPSPQVALEKAAPEVFADSADATPIAVRLRSREKRGDWDALAEFPGMLLGGLTLFTIPWGRTSGAWEVELSVQLGPGVWSDSPAHLCKERAWFFNPITGIFLAWFFPESKGWEPPPRSPFAPIGQGGDCVWLPAMGRNAYNQPAKILWPLRVWPWSRLTPPANDHFVRLLGAMVVEAIDNLSESDLDALKNNPVAWKQYQRMSPFGEANAGGGKRAVAIGGNPSGNVGPKGPTVLEKRYDEATRRGFVKLANDGSDSIRTLKHVRENELPALVGRDASIRILGESTPERGVIQIDFEVVE